MTDTAERTKQILVAGIGNAWLRDDGFGGEVAKLLGERELPAGVHVMDFGSGGLDLAYEVMRGYDALILIDVSRQGERPGTLYVMEADAADVDAEIEDGQMLDPHGMDPQTVLRFVKYVGGWPGRVFVVACEPEVVEDVGFGLQRARQRRARAARPTSFSRPWRKSAVHELSIATAVLNTACKHADDRPVTLVSVRTGSLRQVVPESLQFYFEIVARDTPCEHARLEVTEIAARLRCADCEHEWEPDDPGVPLSALRIGRGRRGGRE